MSWPLETFVERLFVGLAGAGVELTAAPLSSLARPPRNWTDGHRIRWVDDAVPRSPGFLGRVSTGRAGGSLTQALRVDRLIRGNERSLKQVLDGRWDVVWAPWLSVLVDHARLLDLRAPLVTSFPGTPVTIAPSDPSRTSCRGGLAAVFEHSALVHCVSEAILDDAVELGLDRSRARIVRPAVDPACFTPTEVPADGGSVRVIGVGTLNWTKDYEHALVAVRRSVDAGADLRFDLIGDGPDRAHLRFAIDDLDLGDRVRLLGSRPPEAVAADLRRSQIFLHTSCSEGISNAVLEGMATGLPVVTTDAGGMREAVRDGVDGFVVPVRDVASISDALVSLATDPALRARMGTSGRQRVQDEFHLDQQIASFIELFREAAGR